MTETRGGIEQFYDKRNLLQPEQQDEGNAVTEALRSAAYSGLQAPIDGMSQLVNKTLHANVVPEMHFIDAPKAAHFGSGNWHAQQIGGAVGMIAPFMLVNKGIGAVMSKEVGAAEALSLRYKVTQAATSGFVYDALMHPVQENEGNYWTAKLKNATVSAVTFGTLAATAHGLDALGKAPPELGAIRRPFGSEVFNHTVAGIVAGGTNAQLESLLSGHGFAGKEDSMRAGYTFAVVGLGLKGVEKGSATVQAKFADIVRQREFRSDLREVPVIGEDGKVTDVYQKFMSQPDTMLAPEQKQRIFSILRETRERYYDIDNKLDAADKNKGYQVVNWKHTRGEVDQVLESEKLDKQMTRNENEDGILMSIFSDSVKTPQNFIRHHLDGAKLAAEVLPGYFDMNDPAQAARVRGIIEGVKEHQIGPPKFMGFMAQLFIRGSIMTDINSGMQRVFGDSIPEGDMINRLGIVGKLNKPSAEGNTLTAAEGALLDRLGVPRWKIEQAHQIDQIQAKIAKPFESVSSTNKGIVDFNQTQHDFLKLVGVEDWYVPNPETPWYRASRKVINGDSLINYASPDGWAKIVAIRGPNTGFEDATIWDSLKSAKESYNDAYTVIEDNVKPLAEQGLARTEAAVQRVTPQVQKWVDANKEAYGYAKGDKVSFWDRDAEPLKYAEKGHPLEAQDAMRFEFARKIKEQMVEALRAQQGNYSTAP